MKIIKIVKYIFISLLVFITISLLTLVIAVTTNGKQYLEIFGYSAFEVKSCSMYPELNEGDLILVKKRDSSEYKVGMTITYLRPSDKSTTTHKIVSIDGNLVTTKGINDETNKEYDLPFEIDNIVGEVVTVWTGYSDVKQFVTHPIGIIIIILSIFLFVEGLSYLELQFSQDKNSRKEQ